MFANTDIFIITSEVTKTTGSLSFIIGQGGMRNFVSCHFIYQ